jgi:hypothetical protein
MKIEDSNKICWHDPAVSSSMLKGSNGILFPKLVDSNYVHVLLDLVDIAKPHCTSCLDLGCGAADLSDLIVKRNMTYAGADLPHIIQNVAKVQHSSYNYYEFNVETDDDLAFVGFYDLVVMNAFIDIMEHGKEILEKILPYCSKYVLIHRQRIDQKTEAVLLPSLYGGKTWQYTIGYNDLFDTINKNGFKFVREVPWEANSYSFLINKK